MTFLPKGIQFTVVCDLDDPEERIVRVSVCNGGRVASLTCRRTLVEWAELGRKIECYEPSEAKSPLLKSNWKVEPPGRAKYNREERLMVEREYANKFLFQIDVAKKFPGGDAIYDGTGLAMRPERLRELGSKIVAWAAGGAERALHCYLVGGEWTESY